MKPHTYDKTLPFRLEICVRTDNNGCSARYPDILNCFASGKTVREAIENANAIRKKWFEDAILFDIDIPNPKTDGAQKPAAIKKRKYRLVQPDAYAPINALFPVNQPIRAAAYMRAKVANNRLRSPFDPREGELRQ